MSTDRVLWSNNLEAILHDNILSNQNTAVRQFLAGKDILIFGNPLYSSNLVFSDYLLFINLNLKNFFYKNTVEIEVVMKY